jgi:lipoprotein-releasing system ATP-binding protein
MTDIVLNAQSIVKTFVNGDEETRVLKGVDLMLPKGRMIALQGASGSGKSTLLNILGLLMQPTSGELSILGHPIIGLPDRLLSQFRNRHLGFVFQFHNLLPNFSAIENVTFPNAAPAGRLKGEVQERGKILLDRVGLNDRKDFLATRLSGGQKQRVAIARALINQPDLVLADEPTGNLDRKTSEQVMELLRIINQEDQTTFLISTHDDNIAAFCDDRIWIEDGRILTK